MKTILIHSLTGNNNQMFDPNVRDGYNDPAIFLRERLYELGYNLKTADNNSLDECEWVLFSDGSSVRPYSGWLGNARRLKWALQGKPLIRDLYGECIKAGMKDRVALFLWEPPSTSPENWNSELHKLFPLIFTWHDNYVDGRKFIKIHYFQTHQFPNVPNVHFKDKKLLVNISRNKYSRYPRELYSARRAAIRYFEQNQPENFDLYGMGWNQLTNFLEKILPFTCQVYPSYRGTVINKWDVLPQYRFSLCYENIHDEPGYVTEKIFDCIRAGCVPIYWGAPNITDYVDKEAFVDRRSFGDDAALADYLISMSDQEYNQYQEAIKDYLNSERFARFLPPSYADTIIRTLGL